jgi:predicted GNAT family acetyltransferase
MTPAAPAPAIKVIDNAGLNRYELHVGDQVAALANYRLEPGLIVFTYTELLPGFEGRGLGQNLATEALNDVRRRRLAVVARCAFISTFIEDHTEFADLINSPTEGSLTSVS